MAEVYIIGFVIINLISFIMMVIDKRNAKKRAIRIPEISFLVLSALGGFVGVSIGSSLFRHKTLKRSFQFKILFGVLIYFLILYLLNKYALSWC